MATRLEKRRSRLKAEYGFDFPDDFYRFWEFATRVSPLDPLDALNEVLSIALVGPFEILSGRFDGVVPKHSLHLHWRYFGDPPEFFTVLAGGGDGLHWGYYLDDPDGDAGGGCVVDYYARDAYELSVDGDTLFEAVRLHLEYHQRDLEDDEDGDDELADLARLRDRLIKYATGDRPEVGEEYTETYGGFSSRDDRIITSTCDRMGVVAPRAGYRPLSVPDKRLCPGLRKKRFDLTPVLAEARQALADGFPATALKLGKDLWATFDDRYTDAAFELLEGAYTALGRETLVKVIQSHRANRDLPSVDILDES